MSRIAREEIDHVKDLHPIADVVQRYGVRLRRQGRTLVGRCPFHDDHDPSLAVWPAEGRFWCFGCGVGGDVIEFVRQAEGCDFRAAVARLNGTVPSAPTRGRRVPRPTPPAPAFLDDEAVAILDAVADAYHHLLLDTTWVHQLLASRGVSLDTARAYRIGYSDGRRLAPALHRRRLPVQRAQELGLLTGWGERFAQRITFPVAQVRRTAFMMGRRTREEDEPKYLGLPRPKPLYVGGNPEAREALVVEGPFDLWLLHEWGYGERYALVALLGAQPTPAHLAHLRCYARLFVCLDNDVAGREGLTTIRRAMGARGCVAVVPLPPRVHDVGDLGREPKGRERWASIVADVGL